MPCRGSTAHPILHLCVVFIVDFLYNYSYKLEQRGPTSFHCGPKSENFQCANVFKLELKKCEIRTEEQCDIDIRTEKSSLFLLKLKLE